MATRPDETATKKGTPMYSLTKGETRTYPRAYAISTRNGMRVYVGGVIMLTKGRKADIVRHLTKLDSIALPADTSEADLASMFDRSPFCRMDDVTVTLTKVANDDDPNDIRVTWSYSYGHGGGDWNAANTVFATVN